MGEDKLSYIAGKARDVVSIVAALGIVGSVLLFSTNNLWFREQVRTWADIPEIKAEISALTNSVSELTTLVKSVAKDQKAEADPAIRFFTEGSYITNGQPGGTVRFTVRFIKLRDCGRPEIVAWFRNGDGITHSFEDISIVDSHGRGFAHPSDIDEVLLRHFTARVPSNEDVHSGRAEGWIEVGPYSGCLNSPIVSSPKVAFDILPPRGTPIPRGNR